MGLPGALGFVHGAERRRILHLTDRNVAKNTMQSTAAHEFFHHAQSRTRIAGKSSLIDQGMQAWWLTEGTARWFEDEVFDELDTYKATEWQPMARILGAGLAAYADNRRYGAFPYDRFAFIKLVKNRCPGFNLPQILNVDPSNDPNGLEEFAFALRDAEWRCDFGAGFGETNRASLQTALLEYLWLTVNRRSITLLDPDESGFVFDGYPVTLSPAWGHFLNGCAIPRAGAGPVHVSQVPPLPADKKALIQVSKVNAIGPSPWVWIGEEAGGLESGTWQEVTGTFSHLYGGANGAPPMALMLVNPARLNEVPVNIRTAIVTAIDASISFPERVLTIGNCVTWTARVKMDPLAVAGITAAATLESPTNNVVRLAITGRNVALPSTFVVSGTFDADPSSLTGSCTKPDQGKIRWTYSNKQIEHREGSPPHTVTGPVFRFERTATGQQPLQWNETVTVYYDRNIEWLNAKDEVTRTSFQAKAYEAVLQVIVDINSP